MLPLMLGYLSSPVHILVAVVVVILIAALAMFAVRQTEPSPGFQKIANAVIMVVAAIILIYLLVRLLPAL